MKARKIISKIHLWLGLCSGLLVFIIAITGCIYAFQEEIQDMTQPYRFVEETETPYLPPSKIREIADAELPDKHIHAVMYHTENRAAKAIYYSFEDHYYLTAYLNPYTGDVLHIKDEFSGFFRFILDGHFYLWLPPDIGQPVVASATLVFLVMLVSGIFLWWPKNGKNIPQRFSVRWKSRWRRKNYDLHQVLGFYIIVFAVIFALTGLVWGFEWFRDGYYAAITGGKDYKDYYDPDSEHTAAPAGIADVPAIDQVWLKMQQEYPDAAWIEIHPPEDEFSSIAANANPDASTYWQIDYRYFDQYSLKELPVDHIWNRFDEASAGDKLMRMNYDIHVGAILGLPGKFLAFFVSLVVASLPVTGFLIWYGRKKKNKHKKQRKEMVTA
ncbi:PepSY-associated TM helix domain-containing protein [Negadavirga shengliensis]|uniref:PepSY-associated TM helix domain-containing protein n=1 Tax=Negadavirga shengliensis TaxID=1389218 RepID=A0ABV9T650_9BACT